MTSRTLRNSESSAARPVMGREQALSLGKKLLDYVTSSKSFINRGVTIGVNIIHTRRAVTAVTQNRVLKTDDGDSVTISFESMFGPGMPVTINTNQSDDATLQYVMTRAEHMLPPLGVNAPVFMDDLNDPVRYTYNARTFPDVSLWHQDSADAMYAGRAVIIPPLIERLQASGLNGSATVGIAARSRLFLYRYGLTAFADETDCEVTVTARTLDGTGSGWGGQASRSWNTLKPGEVVEQATRIATRARTPVAFEPGRYTAILGPAAVGQLVAQMPYAFDASNARQETPGVPSQLPIRIPTRLIPSSANKSSIDGSSWSRIRPILWEDTLPSSTTAGSTTRRADFRRPRSGGSMAGCSSVWPIRWDRQSLAI
jgi:hypothetical protein